MARARSTLARAFQSALLLYAVLIPLINGEIGPRKKHRLHDYYSHPDPVINSNLETDLMRGLQKEPALQSDSALICYGDDQCPSCYECSMADLSFQCVPIAGCYLSCHDDSDCSDTQFCSDNHVCEEDPTPCYADEECPSPQFCDLSSYQCTEPTPSPTMTGCCAGSSEYAVPRCHDVLDDAQCSTISSCYWISGEDADCDWRATQEPCDPGCCMIAVTCCPSHCG